jgi:hypothetical protein
MLRAMLTTRPESAFEKLVTEQPPVAQWRLRTSIIEEADKSAVTSCMPLGTAANKTTAHPSPPFGKLHTEHASYTQDRSKPGRVMEQARFQS